MQQLLRTDRAALVLILTLVVVTSIATYYQLRDEVDAPALATFSSEPDGARALFLWVEALGYKASASTTSAFAPPQDASLSVILEPQLPGLSVEEWQGLDEWVEQGGTLLLVGEGLGTALSLQHYDFELSYRDELGGDVRYSPLGFIGEVPVAEANLQAKAVLQSERTDYNRMLTVRGEPLVVTIEQGQGVVILSTLPYPFSNIGLKDLGNPQFALSFLTLAKDSTTIWFDEWHHGLRATGEGAPTGLDQWLRRSRPGQALLYTAAVSFLWLLVTGRRFGRPRLATGDGRRRLPTEHAVALANLSRRAGHSSAIRDYYRRELKQHLGSRYGVSAALPDDEYLRRLLAARRDLDGSKLSPLLKGLNDDRSSEQQILEMAQEVHEWITHRV